MNDYTVPIFIMLFNSLILWDLFIAYNRYKDKRFGLGALLFDLSRLLLIANTFAWITGMLDYFIFHSTTIDVLQFGRFADRYVMFFAYKALASYKDKQGDYS